MRNWEEYVRTNLALPELNRQREERIVRELAEQLEDFHREALSRGLTERQADALARGQVPDWTVFAEQIRRADRPNLRHRVDRWTEKIEDAGGLSNRRWSMFADLIQEARLALRQLRRNPGFAAVAILTLAIGIGANTAVFSLVNAVLLRPLPFPAGDRLLWVTTWSRRDVEQAVPVSYPDLTDWRLQAQSFDQLSAVVAGGSNTVTVTGAGEPVRARVELVSSNYFSILGTRPALGRGFLPEDDAVPEGRPVAIVSDRMWREHFGADPVLVGRSIVFDGRAFTVIGIGPEGFGGFSGAADVWIPITVLPPSLLPFLGMRGARWFQVIGELKPGVTVAQAQAEMDGIAEGLVKEHPSSNHHRGVRVTTLAESMFGDVRRPLLILFASVGFVLLIVCANVANLLIARAVSRQKEMAVRTALGAKKGHLARQLLTESVVLSLIGGSLGVLLAVLGASLLQSLVTANLPEVARVEIDLRVLSFGFLLSLLTGILFGLAPLARSARVNVNECLKEGARGSSVTSRKSLRSLMIVAEVAMALILLAGAGLLLRTLRELLAVDPGFVAEHTLVAQFDLPDQGESREQNTVFIRGLLERARALPAVESASISSDVPLADFGSAASFMELEGQPLADPNDAHRVYFHECTAGFFETMGIPLRQGRTFSAVDQAGSLPVVVLSEAAAKRMWPDESPLGKRLRFRSTRKDRKFSWLTVVGVVGDVRYRGLANAPDNDPDVFLSLPQTEVPIVASSFVLSVRSHRDAVSLASSLREIVLDMNPNLPLYGVAPLEENIAAATSTNRALALVLGGFALTALTLTGIGIYGLLNYSVNQRVREIGIRLALGARRSHILGLLLRQGMLLAFFGVVIGIGVALALTRHLSTFLFGVTAEDPSTFAAVSAILLSAALLACWVPAWRAMRVDPLEALRNE